MSDFPQIVKYLDINKAGKATTDAQGGALKDRTKLISKSRAIKKLNYTFNIANATGSNPGFGRIVAQYNFTAPKAFSILHVLSDRVGAHTPIEAAVMCVRYRIGETVYRYMLPISSILPYNDLFIDNTFTFPVQASLYNNQVIKANFCIEFWCLGVGFVNWNMGNLTIVSSLLINPVSADQKYYYPVSPLVSMNRANLVVAFPEALPTVYDANSAWLTN